MPEPKSVVCFFLLEDRYDGRIPLLCVESLFQLGSKQLEIWFLISREQWRGWNECKGKIDISKIWCYDRKERSTATKKEVAV